jgi:hypothetical protein
VFRLAEELAVTVPFFIFPFCNSVQTCYGGQGREKVQIARRSDRFKKKDARGDGLRDKQKVSLLPELEAVGSKKEDASVEKIKSRISTAGIEGRWK